MSQKGKRDDRKGHDIKMPSPYKREAVDLRIHPQERRATMRGDSIADSQRRALTAPSAARRHHAVPSTNGGGPRALDRISDGQMAAVQLIVVFGLRDYRVAQRLGLDVTTIRRWLSDPVFVAACNEFTRAYCAGQLVPLALQRVAQLLGDPFLKLRDAVHAGRFVAELAGLYRTGAPEAGTYAPGGPVPTRPLAEMSADDLQRLLLQGQEAQRRLLAAVDVEIDVDPLS